ncbi:hypothetical protein ABH931_006128 [Streptacidiphilus sp. MAP12-33]|uniref:hypothetical protein n=1 Tax=Streptacidiphilus sp. MAP12-33 TaxID=3156266 RepID=UPI0035189E80
MADTDLRERMAAAIRDDLKRRTVPPILGICGHPINGGMGLTEFELADAALTAVQPELDRLRAVEVAYLGPTADRTAARTVPVVTLVRQIAEKRTAMHQRDEACREVDRLRAENQRLNDVLNGDDMALLCEDCECADCGGTYGQHAPGGVCSCGCTPPCDRFIRDEALDVVTQALMPLLSSPSAEAFAHVVWHALFDVDEEVPDGA